MRRILLAAALLSLAVAPVLTQQGDMVGRIKAEGPGSEFDEARTRALIQECLLG